MPEAEKGKTATIEFDGVYKNCDVWLNGAHLGFHPYGYTGFQYDLTPYLHYGAEPNVLAVRVDDSTQPDARWYSGAGIYRHVWLTVTDALHVSVWGTFVRTAQIRPTVTRVDVDTRVQNDDDTERRCLLVTRILDPDGQVVQERAAFHPIGPGTTHTFSQRLHVENARRWSVEDPVMYTAQSVVTIGEAPRGSMFPTELLSGVTDQVVDSYETPFGIREIASTRTAGFCSTASVSRSMASACTTMAAASAPRCPSASGSGG